MDTRDTIGDPHEVVSAPVLHHMKQIPPEGQSVLLILAHGCKPVVGYYRKGIGGWDLAHGLDEHNPYLLQQARGWIDLSDIGVA